MNVERYVPSVEDALRDYEDAEQERRYWANWCRVELREMAKVAPVNPCCDCLYMSADVEAASVALDMAFALASEERIRASIAWA